MRRGRGRKDTRLSAWLPGFTRLIWREDKIERERERGWSTLLLVSIKRNYLKLRRSTLLLLLIWEIIWNWPLLKLDCRKESNLQSNYCGGGGKTFALEVMGKTMEQERRLKGVWGDELVGNTCLIDKYNWSGFLPGEMSSCFNKSTNRIISVIRRYQLVTFKDKEIQATQKQDDKHNSKKFSNKV